MFQTGLNLMRDLLRRGVDAVGVDCFEINEGFRSRYGKSHLCPNPDENPAEWVAFMKSLARDLGGKPVIIPAADIFVTALGRHAAELESDFRFSRQSVALQAALATKEHQYALAAKAGFPCPHTVYIQSRADLEEFCRNARFPCLLKPRQQREWEALPAGHPFRGTKLVTAESASELLALYDKVQSNRVEAVAQEIIVGPDDAKYCYLAVYGSDFNRLGYCVVQELRSFPIGFGSASVVKPVIDEEIAGICDHFLRSLRYVGLCEIEVKRDARDGKVLLIEVNPRFSGTGDCSIYTGLEVGWLHYLDLIGQSPEPMQPARFDFHHVTLVRDGPAFGQYLDAGLTNWIDWWAPYRGPLEFYDADFLDWKVTFRTVYRSARALAGGILRHWHLRR